MKKRIIAARLGNGHLGVMDADVPPVKPGMVGVEVHNSLISPGTELSGGWRALHRERENRKPFETPRPFGYANAGVVTELGEGVTDLTVGERVACVGAGFASHSNYAVVPHNLCVRLPQGVSFEQASYGMLAATALQGLRRGEPQFGEYTCIVGLGIIGQIAAQLYRLAGCFVIGWDLIPSRVALAKTLAIDEAVNCGEQDAVAVTKGFTKGYGLDSATLAFPGDGNKVLKEIESCMKVSPDGHPMGNIVVVGGVHFEYKSSTTNLDIRRAARTGPGYHDAVWEYGSDYPRVFIRWSTKTNLELCMRLISLGRLNVDALTTHKIPLKDIEEGIEAIIEDPDNILGVVLKMR